MCFNVFIRRRLRRVIAAPPPHPTPHPTHTLPLRNTTPLSSTMPLSRTFFESAFSVAAERAYKSNEKFANVRLKIVELSWKLHGFCVFLRSVAVVGSFCRKGQKICPKVKRKYSVWEPKKQPISPKNRLRASQGPPGAKTFSKKGAQGGPEPPPGC